MTSHFLNVAINHFVYTMSENSWKCLLHFSRDQVDLFKCPVLTDQPSQAYKNSHYASAPGIAVAYGIMRYNMISQEQFLNFQTRPHNASSWSDWVNLLTSTAHYLAHFHLKLLVVGPECGQGWGTCSPSCLSWAALYRKGFRNQGDKQPLFSLQAWWNHPVSMRDLCPLSCCRYRGPPTTI